MTDYEILESGTMPDGANICLAETRFGGYMVIMAFPRLAVDISPSRRTGDTFPLYICEDMDEDAVYTGMMLKEDYQSLIKGKKRLEDLSDHFAGGTIDMWHLGMR